MPETQAQPEPALRGAAHCRWCGAAFDERAQYLAGRVRCGACGVSTTHPWPSPEELEAAYADWYRPQAGRFAGPGDRMLARSRARLARRIDRIAPPGAVLDVGAGDGTLVRAVRATGREALGLERGAVDVDGVESREIEEVQGSFAAVVFWHSLEHLPEPARALEAAARLLMPGGLLVVAVPNAASLQAATFGDSWFGLDIPRHLVHIPAPALCKRVQELGLRVRRVSHLRGGQVVFGWLHGLVGRGGTDLYDAIRRPEARRQRLTAAQGTQAVGAAIILTPLAALLALFEAALRRGGTVALEAVKEPAQ